MTKIFVATMLAIALTLPVSASSYMRETLRVYPGNAPVSHQVVHKVDWTGWQNHIYQKVGNYFESIFPPDVMHTGVVTYHVIGIDDIGLIVNLQGQPEMCEALRQAFLQLSGDPGLKFPGNSANVCEFRGSIQQNAGPNNQVYVSSPFHTPTDWPTWQSHVDSLVSSYLETNCPKDDQHLGQVWYTVVVHNDGSVDVSTPTMGPGGAVGVAVRDAYMSLSGNPVLNFPQNATEFTHQFSGQASLTKVTRLVSGQIVDQIQLDGSFKQPHTWPGLGRPRVDSGLRAYKITENQDWDLKINAALLGKLPPLQIPADTSVGFKITPDHHTEITGFIAGLNGDPDIARIIGTALKSLDGDPVLAGPNCKNCKKDIVVKDDPSLQAVKARAAVLYPKGSGAVLMSSMSYPHTAHLEPGITFVVPLAISSKQVNDQ